MNTQFDNVAVVARQLLGTLEADAKGAMLVEYTILVAIVAMAGSSALVALGASTVQSYDFIRGLLLCPVP